MTGKYDNIKPNGLYYDCKNDPLLNALQLAHLRGEINLYEITTAYEEQWVETGPQEFSPVPGTRRRNDLPPIYLQWKDEYRRRHGLRTDRKFSNKNKNNKTV